MRNLLFPGIDLAGDLESLKKNIAKFKKGKYGGGMSDFDINDLDWIDQNSRKVKAVTIFIYETSVWIFHQVCAYKLLLPGSVNKRCFNFINISY